MRSSPRLRPLRVALLAMVWLTAGCGQKGPLTLPDTPKAQAATAASAPATR